MFIEQSQRGYDRSGQQVVRRARFLILVSLGLERVETECTRCKGTKLTTNYYGDDDLVERSCPNCTRIECTACERKGWTYDPAVDEHAKQCIVCNGKGDLGPSGREAKYVHHKEIRALVRKVAMQQCGHWMMGRCKAFGHKLVLSGSYGGDGLTVTVPREVFDKAIPIPAELHEAWNNGGGWNDAGSEALKMRDWALANLDKLESRKARKARK